VTTYDFGDAVTLTTTVTDASGTPTDATMAILVTAPDGTTSSPSITHGGTGVYSTTFTPALSGPYVYKWSASGAITNVGTSQFTVADPVPPAYASLAELRQWLNITTTDTATNPLLTKALSAASRQIDNRTNRKFWLDAVVSQRIYNPSRRVVKSTGSQTRLIIDDIGATTGLIVEIGSGSSWNPITDYEFWPENAIATGSPVFELSRTYQLWQYSTYDRVRVTARWGWPDIPDEISQATLVLAARFYRRQGSPEGVAGFNDLGVVRVGRRDPDVDALLSNYRMAAFG
jgi:hypothetical protein